MKAYVILKNSLLAAALGCALSSCYDPYYDSFSVSGSYSSGGSGMSYICLFYTSGMHMAVPHVKRVVVFQSGHVRRFKAGAPGISRIRSVRRTGARNASPPVSYTHLA